MEDEMTARHTHLQSVLQVGYDLITAGNFGAEKIQERIDEINQKWESLIDLAAFRKKRLNEAVDYYQVHICLRNAVVNTSCLFESCTNCCLFCCSSLLMLTMLTPGCSTSSVLFQVKMLARMRPVYSHFWRNTRWEMREDLLYKLSEFFILLYLYVLIFDSYVSLGGHRWA